MNFSFWDVSRSLEFEKFSFILCSTKIIHIYFEAKQHRPMMHLFGSAMTMKKEMIHSNKTKKIIIKKIVDFVLVACLWCVKDSIKKSIKCKLSFKIKLFSSSSLLLIQGKTHK